MKKMDTNLVDGCTTSARRRKKGKLDSDLEDRMTDLGVEWDVILTWEESVASILKDSRGYCPTSLLPAVDVGVHFFFFVVLM